MENSGKPSKPTFSVTVIATIVIASLFTGGLLGYFIGYYPSSGKLSDLQNQLSTAQNELLALQGQLNLLKNSTGSDYQDITENVASLQQQLSSVQERINGLRSEFNSGNQNSASLQASISSLQSQVTALQNQIASLQASGLTQDVTYIIGDNFSLSQLFDQVKGSVVIIQTIIRNTDAFGRVYYTQVQGSGFVYRYGGSNIILTNNHVVKGAFNITVTFTNGNSYLASLRGASTQTDFAILASTAPQSIYQPLEITSSSTLKVGDPVIVVGAPYGLSGSMTNGIVSALNRTLSTDGGTTLTNMIQTTAPLNPGNSGGPLMNYNGRVVGITTAIVQESQGIGFAIPSDTILTEIQRIMGT